MTTAYMIMMEKEEYLVTQYPNGKKGLEATKKETFDLILLDLVMPGMDGLEFLRLFNPKKHPETKVIVFTNLLSMASMKKAESLGVTKYISKSDFSPKETVELVQKTLKAK